MSGGLEVSRLFNNLTSPPPPPPHQGWYLVPHFRFLSDPLLLRYVNLLTPTVSSPTGYVRKGNAYHYQPLVYVDDVAVRRGYAVEIGPVGGGRKPVRFRFSFSTCSYLRYNVFKEVEKGLDMVGGVLENIDGVGEVQEDLLDEVGWERRENNGRAKAARERELLKVAPFMPRKTNPHTHFIASLLAPLISAPLLALRPLPLQVHNPERYIHPPPVPFHNGVQVRDWILRRTNRHGRSIRVGTCYILP